MMLLNTRAVLHDGPLVSAGSFCMQLKPAAFEMVAAWL